MRRRGPDEFRMVAPGAGGPSMHLPAGGRPLPPVDEHIAPPETRVEYLNGIEMFASPAKAPHAMKHADLTYVLRAHAAPGYLSAVDMLTRTGEASDFAPDASIFPDALDHESGGRKIEELAFEVSDKQALSVPTEKARQLAARGVRRVFCVLVKHNKLMEWSRALGDWELLPRDAVIEDRCLVRPIPVRSLMDAVAGDGAVAAALLAKKVPELEEALAAREAKGAAAGEARGEAKGEARGLATALLSVLATRGIAVPDETVKQVQACGDATILNGWLVRAATASSLSDVFTAPPTKRRPGGTKKRST